MRTLILRPLFLGLIVIASITLSSMIFDLGVVDGPQQRVLEAGRSLWVYGTLEAPEFFTIGDEALQKSRQNRTNIFWQDAYSFSKDGKRFPKHSFLTVILLSGCYGIFGESAPIFLGWLTGFVLLLSLCSLTEKLTNSTHLGWLLFFCLLLSQEVLGLGGNDFDQLGSAVILSGLAMLYRYSTVGMFICCLSLFVRPTYALFLPFILLFWLANGRPVTIKERLPGFISLVFGCLVYLCANYVMWGNPFLTAYHRVPYYVNGAATLTIHHTTYPSLGVFLSNWYDKLFGQYRGLLLYNPFLWLLPIAIPHIYSHKHRSQLIILLLCSLVQFLYFFAYDNWNATWYGNRFMNPTICLLLVVTFSLLHNSVDKSKSLLTNKGAPRSVTNNELG